MLPMVSRSRMYDDHRSEVSVDKQASSEGDDEEVDDEADDDDDDAISAGGTALRAVAV